MVDLPEHDADKSLRELGRYFMGTSDIHKTAARVTKLLRDAGIDHAVAGALALNAHGYVRATEDVDVLLTREGLTRFKELWLGRGYIEPTEGNKAVRDTETKVKIDFLITGDFPGDGKPKAVAFPDPKNASETIGSLDYVPLATLVELKVASGMTAPHRPRDFDDVIRLIEKRSLPRDFTAKLNPYVHAKYLELWELAQIKDDQH